MAKLSFENLPFLASIAEGATPEACRVWLRVATDQFTMQEMHTQDELIQFGHSARKFLDQVDSATRLLVAQKLSACPATPENVLEHFVKLGGPAAHHVLQYARGLPREALIEAAQSGTTAATLVALRSDLDRGLVALLTMRADYKVLYALAGNASAPLDIHSFTALARFANKDKKIALALLSREPLGAQHAALFLHADSDQRRAILIDAQRAVLGRANGAPAPALDEDSLVQLEHLSIARQVDLFELGLSEALHCDLPTAEAIVRDRTGEPLALALAALGAPDDMAVRILIASDVQCGVEFSRINALSRLRDAMSPLAAQQVLAAITGNSMARPPRHRPGLDAGAHSTPSRPQVAGVAALSGAAARRRRALEFVEIYRDRRA